LEALEYQDDMVDYAKELESMLSMIQQTYTQAQEIHV
jgi:hypothetical protein